MPSLESWSKKNEATIHLANAAATVTVAVLGIGISIWLALSAGAEQRRLFTEQVAERFLTDERYRMLESVAHEIFSEIVNEADYLRSHTELARLTAQASRSDQSIDIAMSWFANEARALERCLAREALRCERDILFARVAGALEAVFIPMRSHYFCDPVWGLAQFDDLTAFVQQALDWSYPNRAFVAHYGSETIDMVCAAYGNDE